MTTKVPPPKFSKEKSFEMYKQEVAMWQFVTETDPTKHALTLILNLPENDPIREQVLDNCTQVDLKKATGVETYLAYLEKVFGKDDLCDTLDKYKEFRDFKKTDGISMQEYISSFIQKHSRIVKKGLKLPDEVLAFELIRNANISKDEEKLVLTGLNLEDKDKLFEGAQKSLRKFMGQTCVDVSGVSGVTGSAGVDFAIKTEPIFATGAARSWRGRSRGRARGTGRGVSQYGRNDFDYKEKFGIGNGISGPSPSSIDRNWRGSRNVGPWKTNRPVNALDVNGEPMRCHACGSFRHFLNHCPDRYEVKAGANKVFLTDMYGSDEASGGDKRLDSTKGTTFHGDFVKHEGGSGIDRLTGAFENIVMFTGYSNDTLSQLCTEAHNSGVVDTACTSIVCGKRWLHGYYDSLDDDDQNKVVSEPSDLVFRFGDGPLEHSKASVVIPVQIDGVDLKIRTDVVECDVPLLFSKTFIKQVFPLLDLANDMAKCSLTGRMVALDESTSGHYTIPLSKDVKVKEVYAVNMLSLGKSELKKKLYKLHSQFGHPAKKKLISLMKNAGCWNDSFNVVLEKIHSGCQLCKQFAKTPPRPVVALPLATEFNQVVCMDLKQWENKWILHMIDMYTRYTISVFLDRKLATGVIDAVMMNWVGLFGVMNGVLTDNGGEFTSEEIREVASILNIDVKTTAAESPWQNGLCERVHQVSDMILLKLQAEYPKSRLHVLLKWANLARNSLQMWNGFSSHQLVFGRNPNLPDVMNARIPALDEYTNSQVFAEHLNALHAARQAYTKSESAERIRRALRHKVRASQQKFEIGERVYYKREGREKWLGPGKVMFQDGKIVFVRHGSVYVRVSVNRLIKADGVSETESTEVNRSNIEETSEVEESGNVQDLLDSDEDSEQVRGVLDEVRNVHNDVSNENDGGLHGEVTVAQVVEDAKKEAENLMKASDSWVSEPRKSQRVVNKQLGSTVYLTFVPKENLNSKEVLAAKEAELDKLKQFDTYEAVSDQGQSRISTRWVMTVKENKPRARLVARGFEEIAQTQNDSPTIGKSAMRMFLTLMASFHWMIRTTDIKSAFLQGKELQRTVFISPPKEAQAKGKLWKLKRCIYGLNDASRQFFLSVCEEMIKLGCVQSKLEPSLFYKISTDGKLIGVMVCHVDDFLHAGTDFFDEQVMNLLRRRFQTSKVVDKEFNYLGFQIHQHDSGIWLDQDHYVESLEVATIPVTRSTEKKAALTSDELTSYRALVGSINWIVCGTRPDMYFDMIELSTKFRCALVEDWLRARKVLRRLQEEHCGVFFPDIGSMKDARLCVFTDAAFGNLSDGASSTAGYVVFAIGKDKACPLSWKSNKIKRVVRSTLAAEVLACLDGLEDCLYLKAVLRELLPGIKLPIIAYVDSKSLKDNLQTTKLVDNKQLRIDMSGIKQMLERNEIDSLRWCSGLSQLADCLTKRGASGQLLRTVFHTGKLVIEN